MTSTKTLNLSSLPNWLYDFLRGLYHNWPSFLAMLIGLVLVSFLFYYRNHRNILKTGEKLGGTAVHLWLTGLSAAITGVSYYLPVLQTHLRTLETLPYIGTYMITIYAGANFFYALKGKKWWASLLSTSEKLDAKLNPTDPVTVPDVPEAPASPDEAQANFVS